MVMCKTLEKEIEKSNAQTCGGENFCLQETLISYLPAVVIFIVNFATKKIIYWFASQEKWPQVTQQLSSASKSQTVVSVINSVFVILIITYIYSYDIG